MNPTFVMRRILEKGFEGRRGLTEGVSISDRQMKIQGTQIGRSERAIYCELPQRENAHFLKSKLEDLRRHKERQNKFDRSCLVEQMERLESIKKLRSATKGASNLEGIKKVVRRLRNSHIRSFSRKVVQRVNPRKATRRNVRG